MIFDTNDKAYYGTIIPDEHSSIVQFLFIENKKDYYIRKPGKTFTWRLKRGTTVKTVEFIEKTHAIRIARGEFTYREVDLEEFLAEEFENFL